MAGQRIVYLAVLFGCGVFYLAYGEWFGWVALLFVLGLPWVSLLISLPAMLQFHMAVSGPDALEMGQEGSLMLLGTSLLPMPPFKGRIRLQSGYTGESRRYTPGTGLDTRHCGSITATVDRARICDYLGLFSFPIRKKDQKVILIRPKALPVEAPGDLTRYVARAWRPKFGGGFSENHELRLYRPGDSLNQVHWKLTAKTGKLMLREPMEPQRGLLLLTLTLRGTPEELDRKLGRLRWMGQSLLKQQLSFELRALTAGGLLSFPIQEQQDLKKAIDQLLKAAPVAQGSIRDQNYSAAWQYHIGGNADES